ncbi:MAG: hypothetical protein ACLUHE_03325 [Christensenellales bacterium]
MQKANGTAFTAVVDSGNCLRDYLTHRPVIVMPQARGYRLFGLENTPLRPIFADTAGGRQMMLCLTPEANHPLTTDETERAVEALLALSPGLGERPGSAAGLAAERRDGQEGLEHGKTEEQIELGLADASQAADDASCARRARWPTSAGATRCPRR